MYHFFQNSRFIPRQPKVERAWSHLPNATHIDRVLASVQANPEIWTGTYDESLNWDRETARDVILGVGNDSALDAAYERAQGENLDAAWDAIVALIAYDDSARYMVMSSAQLQAVIDATDCTAPRLLLAAVRALEV
jgi:alcohol dehydrogenase YqhD (iron-dependent ADH family)